MENNSSPIFQWRLFFRVAESIRNYHNRNHRRNLHPEPTVAQIRVMSCVLMSPEKCVKLKEIAGELGITPGAASQLVDSLVQPGFLERRPDPRDRRAVQVTLSPDGRKLFDEVDGEFSRLFDELTAGVDPKKLEICREVFLSILEALETRKGLHNSKK